MQFVDTDSHIMEPPDVFTARMSKQRWGDLIPTIRCDKATGVEAWYVDDTRLVDAWANNVAVRGDDGSLVRWDAGTSTVPQRMDLVHPSAYDGAERIKVLDQHGIQAAVLYPNLGLGFSRKLRNLVGGQAEEFYLDCIRAYNDFVVDWTSSDPRRFVRLASIPFWDVAASVKEIERCAELGFKGVVTTGTPHLHGQPYLPDPAWDRLWEAISAQGMSISFHIGGGDSSTFMQADRVALEGIDTAVARGTVTNFLHNAITLTDLLLSGVLPRFPELKFVIVESGISWVPFVLEAVDYHFRTSNVRHEHPEFESLPSDYFRRQVFVNFWFEEVEPWQVEQVGIDRLLYETDFPHPTSLIGDQVPDTIEASLGKLDNKTREAILSTNATSLYDIK